MSLHTPGRHASAARPFATRPAGRAVMIATGAALLVGTAACGAGHDSAKPGAGQPTKPAAQAAQASTKSAAQASGKQPTAAPIPGKNGVAGAAHDLSKSTCSYAHGVWTFSGVLTNAAKSKQAYTVRVNVAKTKNSSVVALASLNAKLAPGAHKQFQKVTVGKSGSKAGLQCVVNVTRVKA